MAATSSQLNALRIRHVRALEILQTTIEDNALLRERVSELERTLERTRAEAASIHESASAESRQVSGASY